MIANIKTWVYGLNIGLDNAWRIIVKNTWDEILQTAKQKRLEKK
jgi:hypothetical protein